MGLSDKTCVPCQGGIAPIEFDDAKRMLADTSGWELVNDGRAIKKHFKFSNFIDSQNFVNKVGIIAEEEQHHPDISFGWGYAEILIYTHKIDGLHENDFILAAKINGI